MSRIPGWFLLSASAWTNRNIRYSICPQRLCGESSQAPLRQRCAGLVDLITGIEITHPEGIQSQHCVIWGWLQILLKLELPFLFSQHTVQHTVQVPPLHSKQEVVMMERCSEFHKKPISPAIIQFQNNNMSDSDSERQLRKEKALGYANGEGLKYGVVGFIVGGAATAFAATKANTIPSLSILKSPSVKTVGIDILSIRSMQFI